MGQEQSGEYDPASAAPDASTTPDETTTPDVGADADDIDSDDSAPINLDDDTDLQTLSAYRVMKVFQGSPASRSGLTPFEDFIVAVKDTLVTSDNSSLASVLSAHEGSTVDLLLYNVVDAARRNVALRPVKWNGPGLLGAAVRYEPIAAAMDHVHRVVDVLDGSPAKEAGLVADTDYIVGTPAEVFRSDAHLSKLVSFQAHIA